MPVFKYFTVTDVIYLHKLDVHLNGPYYLHGISEYIGSIA